MLKDRASELKTVRDQAASTQSGPRAPIERLAPSITPRALKTFARTARKRRQGRLPSRPPSRRSSKAFLSWWKLESTLSELEKATLADETFGRAPGWTLQIAQQRIWEIITVRSVLPESHRDVRLDLFCGLANWLIFLGHIPDTVLTWFTTRNYGFSEFLATRRLSLRHDDDGAGIRHGGCCAGSGSSTLRIS